MRLTDPEWVLGLIATSRTEDEQDKENVAPENVGEVGEIGEWVPLPSNIMRREAFDTVVRLSFCRTVLQTPP